MKAYKSNDIKSLSKHIKEIHDVLHAYMDSDDSNDYDSQNEKAAEEQE